MLLYELFIQRMKELHLDTDRQAVGYFVCDSLPGKNGRMWWEDMEQGEPEQKRKGAER